uniref:Uncharacterized protein n=1 Tax=Oryza rufipogon TaxID=4529 RepID=A0A0E0QRN4_ORYRU
MLVAPIKEFVWLEKPAIVSDNAMSGVHHENNGQSFEHTCKSLETQVKSMTDDLYAYSNASKILLQHTVLILMLCWITSDNCAVYKKLKKILKKDLSDLIVQLNGSEWMETCVKTAGFSTFSKETNISGIFPDHQMTSERKARGSQELIESNIRIDTTLLIHVAASKHYMFFQTNHIPLSKNSADAAPSRRRRSAIATPPRHPRRRLAPHANRRRPAPPPASPILHRALSWPASPIYPDRCRRPHHPSTPCLHVNLHRLPGLETVAIIGKTNGANLFAWDDRRGLLAVGCWKRLTIFRLDNENSAPHCLFFLGCDLSVYGYGLTVTSFGFRWKLRWPVGSAQFGEWEPLSHDEARSLFAFVAPYVNEAKETKSSSSLPQKVAESEIEFCLFIYVIYFPFCIELGDLNMI